MELNGWSSPQMLARYGRSARGARAHRHYDESWGRNVVMHDAPAGAVNEPIRQSGGRLPRPSSGLRWWRRRGRTSTLTPWSARTVRPMDGSSDPVDRGSPDLGELDGHARSARRGTSCVARAVAARARYRGHPRGERHAWPWTWPNRRRSGSVAGGGAGRLVRTADDDHSRDQQPTGDVSPEPEEVSAGTGRATGPSRRGVRRRRASRSHAVDSGHTRKAPRGQPTPQLVRGTSPRSRAARPETDAQAPRLT